MESDIKVPLDVLFTSNEARPSTEVSTALTERPTARWSAYVAGCLYEIAASGVLPMATISGLNILIDSTVPIGAGVSSSAALEVAAMTAICGHFMLEVSGLEIARMCQRVENRIAGAPCGIMDQVTSSLGRENELLVLKCQPHDVLGFARIPTGWEFVGIDSGVKHSVGGSSYARARTAAFMGLKILNTLASSPAPNTQDPIPVFQYLCDLGPDMWEPWRERIPETLKGREFQSRFGELPDTVTRVDPSQAYFVRACTEHPILENDRVRQFLSLMNLAGEEPDEMLMSEAGALMVESHRSYSDRLDLGSPETDSIVDISMGIGPERGIFGAKITGGGSGGTVAVLCSKLQTDRAINDLTAEYTRRTGIQPRVMRGSSIGAIEFGARTVSV
jgi:L-arabinokinase